MIIEAVTMQNVGRHDFRDDDTDASTVGILGPNGEGKSTWIDVVRICLTGSARDTLNTYMRDGGVHGKTEMGVRFRKNGKRGSIRRTISKSTTTRVLEWEGKTYKAAAEVDEILAGILNADKRSVMNCVFVPQGDLNKILFGDEGERKTQFIRMLGCGHYEAVSRAAKQQAIKLRADTLDLEPTRVEITAQIEGHRDRFNQLGAELALLADGTQDIARLVHWRDLKAARQTSAVRLEQSRGNVITTLQQVSPGATFEQAREIMSRENAAADLRRSQITVLTQERDKFQRELDETQFLIDFLERYLQAKADYDKMLAEPPVPPSFQSDIQICSTALQTANTRQRDLQQIRQKQARHRELTAALAGMRQDLIALQAATVRLGDKAQAAIAAHEEASKNPRIWLLTMQIDLLAGIARHDTMGHRSSMQNCPLCQSQEGVRNMTPEAVQGTLQAAQTELAALNAAVQTALSARAEAERFLRSNGTDVTSLQSQILAYSSNLQDLDAEQPFATDPDAEAPKLQQTIADLTQRLTDLQNGEKLRNQTLQQRAVVEAAWTAVTTLTPARQQLLARAIQERSTKGTCEVQLQLIQTAVGKNRETMEQLADANSRFKSWWDYLVQEGNKYNDLLAADAKLAPDEAPGTTLEAIQSELATLEVTAQKRRDLMASRNELQTAVDQCQTRLTELERRQQMQHGRIMLANEMDTVAKVFSKEGVVSVFMADVFERMLNVIGPHLELLAAPFVVRRGEEPLSFEFKRTDEDSTWQPDYKLSGGQRVKMSVAFLLALHQVVIPDVGLLVLDEPTVHLDAESRENTRDLFENLGAILERTECQLIVCDHCPEILPALKKKVIISRKLQPPAPTAI